MKSFFILQKLVLLSFLLLCQPNIYAAEKQESLRHVSSEDCEKCHDEIYEQWKGSMHAQSTALEDPIHGTFYKAVIGDPTKEGVKKGGKYPVCLQCHSPAAAKDLKTKLDAKLAYKEGVNCIACHTMTKFKGTVKPDGGLRLGMKAYEFSDTMLQGPRGITEKDHKKWGVSVASNPGLLKTSDACMGCHDQRPNANKVPLCATGDEIAKAGGSTTCQTCHMPVIEGEANHAMMGGHDPATVGRGVVITVDTEKAGKVIKTKVKVRNLLPHNFPTGAPFRNFYVKVTAYDKSGAKVWNSTESHPIKDDQLAMMMYKLGDKGQPAPPPKATMVLGDSRLKPNETRILSYEIPARNVVKIIAVGYYDLLLPPIKKKFGKNIPDDLKKAQKVAQAIVKL